MASIIFSLILKHVAFFSRILEYEFRSFLLRIAKKNSRDHKILDKLKNNNQKKNKKPS